MIFASPFTDEGSLFLETALGVLADLQVSVSLDKLEGPSTTVTFLGILIETARLALWLPLDKGARLRRLVAAGWEGGPAVTQTWSQFLAISPMQQLW